MARCTLATTLCALISSVLATACDSRESPHAARRAPEPATSTPSAAPPARVDPAAAPAAAAAAARSLAAVPRGEALYARMCAVCHGAEGEGYKADRAPALAHPDFIGSVSDEFLRAAILEGRRGTTMSSWGRDRGGPLGTQDADDLIAFMRTWEKGRPRVKLDDSPLRGDAARGRPIFERECVRCHGVGGAGGPHTQLADVHLVANASDGFLRHAIARGRPGTPMEGYAGKLSPRDIDDVIAFVREASQLIAAELAEQATTRPTPLPLPLGPVPLNPRGPQPVGFVAHPGTTPSDVVHFQLSKGARMAFLDARPPPDYTLEHIAGAVSVPFYEPEPYFAKLPKNAWLVCYCGCPHAESKMLAQKLLDHGFTKVTVLDEGIGFWKMKGYPVRSGSEP